MFTHRGRQRFAYLGFLSLPSTVSNRILVQRICDIKHKFLLDVCFLFEYSVCISIPASSAVHCELFGRLISSSRRMMSDSMAATPTTRGTNPSSSCAGLTITHPVRATTADQPSVTISGSEELFKLHVRRPPLPRDLCNSSRDCSDQ